MVSQSNDERARARLENLVSYHEVKCQWQKVNDAFQGEGNFFYSQLAKGFQWMLDFVQSTDIILAISSFPVDVLHSLLIEY